MHNEPASRAPQTTNNNHIQQRKKTHWNKTHGKEGRAGDSFFYPSSGAKAEKANAALHTSLTACSASKNVYSNTEKNKLMLRYPNNATMTWIRCHHEVKFICTLALRFAKSGYTWSRTSLFRILLLYYIVRYSCLQSGGEERKFIAHLHMIWTDFDNVPGWFAINRVKNMLICIFSFKRNFFLLFVKWIIGLFVVDWFIVVRGHFAGHWKEWEVRWQSFCMHDFAWRMEDGKRRPTG